MNKLAILFGFLAFAWNTGVAQSIPTVQPLAGPHPGFSSAGAGRNSTSAFLSSNGRVVAFLSQANDLVTNDHNGLLLDVFIRNLTDSSTRLISVNASGTSGGNGNSFNPALSADGRFVIFESSATDLVPNDSNKTNDIFIRDALLGTTVLATVNRSGTGSGNGASFNAAITPDGHKVVFESLATDLVTNQVIGWDIYVRDLQNGTTTWVSTNGLRSVPGDTASQNAISQKPAISANGRFVAYSCLVTNLYFYPNRSEELVVRDLQTGTTTLASSNVANILTNGGIAFDNLVLSSNGQFLACKASGTNAVVIFWEDLQSGIFTTITTNTHNNLAGLSDSAGPTLSDDGRFVAYEITNSICLWDSQSQTSRVIYADTPALAPLLSSDGRYLSFLAKSATSNGFQLFVWDSVSGTTNLLSVSSDGSTPSNSEVSFPAMSADGRIFAFQAFDGNLITNDNNRAMDVFVRDLNTQTTQLASRRESTLPLVVPSGFGSMGTAGSISSNGQYLVFSSHAENLAPNDTNQCRDVFVRDLFGSITILASVNTNGVAANAQSADPVISANGRFVAFISLASDLVTGSSNLANRIYLRDLATSATQMIGTNDSNFVYPSRPAISADGNVVAYQMSGSLFQWDSLNGLRVITNGVSNLPVFLSGEGRYIACVQSLTLMTWDSVAGVSTVDSGLVNQNVKISGFSGNGSNLLYSAYYPPTLRLLDLNLKSNLRIADNVFESATLSFDARFIAYANSSSPSINSVYVWDSLLQTSILASPTYKGVVSTAGSSDNPVISPNGRYVVFTSRAPDLIPGNTNRYSNIYLRDLQAGVTTLLSANPSGSVGDNVSVRPVFGPDGATIVFNSAAFDLISNDFNGSPGLFYFRLPGANFIDTDHDRMDDNWERKYFGDLSHDGSTDSDGDGQSDLQEYLAGTDPTDQNSVLKGTQLAPPENGAVSINWKAQPGVSYRIQYKNSLSDSNWVDLPAELSVAGSNGAAVDNSVSGVPQRFYRIVTVP